jgi:hypothetical protein
VLEELTTTWYFAAMIVLWLLSRAAKQPAAGPGRAGYPRRPAVVSLLAKEKRIPSKSFKV